MRTIERGAYFEWHPIHTYSFFSGCRVRCISQTETSSHVIYLRSHWTHRGRLDKFETVKIGLSSWEPDNRISRWPPENICCCCRTPEITHCAVHKKNDIPGANTNRDTNKRIPGISFFRKTEGVLEPSETKRKRKKSKQCFSCFFNMWSKWLQRSSIPTSGCRFLFITDAGVDSVLVFCGQKSPTTAPWVLMATCLPNTSWGGFRLGTLIFFGGGQVVQRGGREASKPATGGGARILLGLPPWQTKSNLVTICRCKGSRWCPRPEAKKIKYFRFV